ncbi:hypothetical protein D3P08_05185 [Paenibacillus nanensis]|uniref:Uncharacterized protein n=1 Tax=Paenibacillus nanensis TaxID=393251 RepID=A0A3A1VG53_9BACL|nr:hypothetical protein [Paenibacillus nanensis]RIX59537.1 hypothetical protein D3P08_05185 [Paenibacillus nanensis]
MKKFIQLLSPIMFLAYLLLTRYVPMHDFVDGLLAGLSIGLSVLALILFAQGSAPKKRHTPTRLG